MRTIDADEFKEKLLKERDAIPLTFKERYGFEMPNKHGNSMRGGIRKALRCMEQCPTIDAVPVVRCWDCGHGLRCVDGYVRCSHPSGKVILMKSSDFCSYGIKDGDS